MVFLLQLTHVTSSRVHVYKYNRTDVNTIIGISVQVWQQFLVAIYAVSIATKTIIWVITTATGYITHKKRSDAKDNKLR